MFCASNGGIVDAHCGGREISMHWDATAWTVVPTPTDGWFSAVKAFSATDVFAVGTFREQAPFGPLGWNAVAYDSDAAGEYPRVALRDLGSRRIDMGRRCPRAVPESD